MDNNVLNSPAIDIPSSGRAFGRPLKAFIFTKLFAYTQSAFAQFLINIYFWRITKNIPFLVLYNVIFLLFHTLTYLPAGKIAKERNRFLPLRFGVILQIAYLLLIIFLRGNIVHYIIPIAIIGGIAHGAYWFSDNLLKFDLTHPENRLKFTATCNIMQSAANSVVPLLASILVVADGGIFSSYARVFILAIIFAGLVLASSFYIPAKKKIDSSPFNFFVSARKLLRNRNIRIACFSSAFRYISSALPILIGLLLFISSGTELYLGGYQFITVLIVMITNYIMGRYFSRKNYRALLIWGGITNFVLVFILFISQSYTAILLYGILGALFSFLNAPTYPIIQNALSMYSTEEKECVAHRAEYMVLIEIFTSAGAILGFGVLLLISNFLNKWLIGGIIALFALTDLFTNIYLTKIKDGLYSRIDQLN